MCFISICFRDALKEVVPSLEMDGKWVHDGSQESIGTDYKDIKIKERNKDRIKTCNCRVWRRT